MGARAYQDDGKPGDKLQRIELVGPDHERMASSRLAADGTWTAHMAKDARRGNVRRTACTRDSVYRGSMTWRWMEERRRRAILDEPWPSAWDDHLRRNMRHFQWLDEEEQRRLRELVQVFVAIKHWEGCGGLVIDDEIRVTIAGQACLLVLALPHELYRNVRSIFVYPSTVETPYRRMDPGSVAFGPIPILGEAALGGPIVLVWDAVLRQGRHPELGHNVVYHEFAHKLDMLDGCIDGTPEFEQADQLRRWVEVGTREYKALRAARDEGRPTLLDHYGAVNVAEFFAVVTECFFDRALAMSKRHPALYGLLREFYRQDPAVRESRER